MKIWNWIKSLRVNVEFYHAKSIEELLKELPNHPFHRYKLHCKCGMTILIPYIPGNWPIWKPHEELTVVCGRCKNEVSFNTADIYTAVSNAS